MAQAILFPAVIPPFGAGEDLEELGRRIGIAVENIQDTNSESSVLAKFKEAIMLTRIDLFRLVGDTRIADIQVTAWVENPDTDVQIVRNTASILEGKMVVSHLYKTLGIQLRDGNSGEERDAWNDVPLFRHLDMSQIDRLLADLENDIDNLLGLILLPPEAPEDDMPRAMSIGPTTTPFRPGQSVWNR